MEANISGPQLDVPSDLFTVTDLVQTGRQLGEATRIHVGCVYNTSLDGVRTKRPEITLTRDLEYLRVYDIKAGRISASYPDVATFFHSCAPHCLVIRQQDGRSKRLMWHAVASKVPHTRHENSAVDAATEALVLRDIPEGRWLRCKIDYISQDGVSLPAEQQPGSTLTSGIVSCLESIIIDGNVFLLAAYANGMLAAYTHDLRTASSPIADTIIGETIERMTTIGSDRAKRGILKPVSNIHSTLTGSRLLVIVSRVHGGKKSEKLLRIRVYQFSLRPSILDRPITTLLFQRDINVDSAIKAHLSCEIHDEGQFLVWGKKTMQVWDLSEHSAKPYRTFQFEDEIASVLRLNQNSIAVCTTKMFQQISLDYSTTQGSFLWPIPLQQSAITKQYNGQLITYSRKSGQLLCLYDTKVITVGVMANRPPTIADLIDRGVGQSHMTARYQHAVYENYFVDNPKGEVPWTAWTSYLISLAEHVQKNNTADFDKIFCKLLAFCTSVPDTTNLETITLSPSQLLQNDEKLATIVSSIFEPIYQHDAESSTFRLRVKILPTKTFHWLLKNSLVTSSQVEHYFRRIGRFTANTPLQQTAVVQALADHDGTLATLQYFALHSSVLSAAEAVYLIARSLGLEFRSSATKMAADIPDNEMETVELDQPSPSSQSGDALHQQNSVDMDEGQSDLIRISLIRLVENDHPVITATLKQQLTHQELFALVEYLRSEMSQQGWFVEVLNQDGLTLSNGDGQYTISRLVKILGCVLDALGMTPWLTSTTLAENENLVAWMRMEISAALEAVEEATYMSKTLHEVSLFTKLLDFTEHDRPAQGSRRIEPITIDDGLMGNNALPPGLKPAGYIDTNIIKAGRPQKMSQRLIGKVKSKMVGAYSRERIDLGDL